jgi:transcriptional regulator with XRE-family HTH domain
MPKFNKIKGRLLEMEITQREAAEKLGIQQATLSQKLNNIRPMSLSEANALGRLLNLTNDEYYEIFFAD